jgi:hypothetical protein
MLPCMQPTKLKAIFAPSTGESVIRNVARLLTFVPTRLILIPTENLLCLELVSKKETDIELVRHARACLFCRQSKNLKGETIDGLRDDRKD